MADHMNPESENVDAKLKEAGSVLDQAERIFREETTSEHRDKWPNVYRLESATKFAQDVLAVANPHITQLPAAQEFLEASTQARDAMREAVDSGGGDLIGSANRLLAATSQIEPGPVSPDLVERLGEIRQEVDSTKGQIETQIADAGAEVAGQKDQAFASISEDVEAVASRREAAEQQASELGLVTSSIAAENLADAYGEVAKETEDQAKRYTWASTAIGVLSIVIAGLGVYSAGDSSEVHTLIARAALGIPVALFAAYINSLAGTHRREAWRLRHIELQIRTANPFLGLLASERREEVLGSLALRFFPGQEGVSFDGEHAINSNPELIELLRKLIQNQAPSTGHPPSAPPQQS